MNGIDSYYKLDGKLIDSITNTRIFSKLQSILLISEK
jgi:hypothetical protein